jgi:hypothetical protein
MAKAVVNITNTQSPATDALFSEQQANTNIGPTPVLPPNASLENNAVQPSTVKDAAIWNPMAKFDDGLKQALVDFTNTTHEGVKSSISFKGRQKILDFFFSGTATKSVRPSEIGHFRVIFSYPANINVQPLATVAPGTVGTALNATNL